MFELQNHMKPHVCLVTILVFWRQENQKFTVIL